MYCGRLNIDKGARSVAFQNDPKRTLVENSKPKKIQSNVAQSIEERKARSVALSIPSAAKSCKAKLSKSAVKANSDPNR